MSEFGKLNRWPDGFLNGTIDDVRIIVSTERAILDAKNLEGKEQI